MGGIDEHRVVEAGLSAAGEYSVLDETSVLELAASVLPRPSRAEEIGDGNLNLIFRVLDESGASVIVKQALPYLRIAGDSWPLTLDRARIESEALELQNRVAPGLVPELLRYDGARAAIVMEDLCGYEVWRGALNARRRYPRAAAAVGRFCGLMVMATSNLGLAPDEWKRLAACSINPEMCAITEDLVFSAPYIDAASNDVEDHLLDEAAALRSDPDLLEAAAELRYRFRTRAEALIHGDLHTGSVMVAKDGTRVIDPEFAFMGPPAFDSGAVVGNLAIAFLAHRAQGDGLFADSVAGDAEAFWRSFVGTINALWPHGEPWQARLTANLLDETGRYAGVKMIRRIVGLAHVTDITGIADAAVRRRAQLAVLRGGRALLLARRLESFGELWDTATAAIAVEAE